MRQLSNTSFARVNEPTLSDSAKLGLPRTIVVLGWVSRLTESVAAMIYPLVPELVRSIGGGVSTHDEAHRLRL